MLDQVIAFWHALLLQSGVASFTLGNFAMIVFGAGIIFVAVVKRYEPLLLAGVGFACIVVNLPGVGVATLAKEGGLFHYAYLGMSDQIIPLLIALGIGAMTDFGPLIASPRLILLGAGAQVGVLAALVIAKSLGFTLKEAGAIGLIGGADGPLAIFVTAKLAPQFLGPVALAAFSFLALMPMLQKRVLGLVNAKPEIAARALPPREASKLERIAFPIVIAFIFNLLFPQVAPLITMLMFGNLLREVEGAGGLAKNAAAAITNIIVVILTLAIGSTMAADKFLTVQSAQIVVVGFLAFVGAAASTVATAKLMSLFVTKPISPLFGFAAKASAGEGALAIEPAMGANVAGVFGAAIAGAIMLAVFGVN